MRILTGRFRTTKDAKFLHADNEDSNQTVHMSEGTFTHVTTHIKSYIYKTKLSSVGKQTLFSRCVSRFYEYQNIKTGLCFLGK